MKRLLHFTNREDGFVFPFVLFVAVIIFIIITSHIYVYHHDIHITNNHQEQLKMETLFQMSRVRVKEDLPVLDQYPSHISYQFPYGDVTVFIPDKNSRQITFHIYTDNNAEKIIPYHL